MAVRPGRLGMTELPAAVLADVCARAGDREGYAAWVRQVQQAGHCARPVRLVGGVDHANQQTGEARTVFDSTGEPDGIVLKACGTRRAVRCPPCAEVYRRDAYQLVRAGLAGGKGVPETVRDHPSLFVTFTAPSFGPVHARRDRGGTIHACHPARQGARCAHGRRLACWHRHQPDDPILGEPLCPECFDYQGVAVWNALAPELWRRTTIYLGRTLARLAGVPRGELARRVRLSYVKVAEYQRRGLVHYHAIIRLDGRAPGDREAVVAPPPEVTVELLAEAIRRTAAAVTVPAPAGRGGWVGPPIRWGEQLDVRTIGALAEGALSAEQLAGYIAKYATKATENFGVGLDRPIRRLAELDRLDLPPHVAALVRVCWQLGARPELAPLRLRQWAHALGYRGHWTTKSRRYSTTMRALRAARRAWANRHRYGSGVGLDGDGYLLPPAGAVAVASWEYAGSGYTTTGDAWLAASLAAQAREQRRIARDELAGAT